MSMESQDICSNLDTFDRYDRYDRRHITLKPHLILVAPIYSM